MAESLYRIRNKHEIAQVIWNEWIYPSLREYARAKIHSQKGISNNVSF
mgnify:CR=1 FL=1